MLIKTTMFGEIDIDQEQIIDFPDGLIGFDSIKRYSLINMDDNSPFSWLQAVDEPHISFLVIDPVVFEPTYKVPLTKEMLNGLNAGEPKCLQTVVIVTVPEDPNLMTANMKGPVIINSRTCVAKQIVMTDECYKTRQRIFTDNGNIG